MTSNSVKYSNVNGLVKPSCHENSEYKNEPRRQDHYYNYTKFTSKVVPKNVTKFSHDNVPVAVKPRNVAQLESKMAQHSIDYNNAHKGKDKARRKNISSSSDNQYVSFNVLQKSTPQNKLNINNLVGSKKTISLVESPAFLDQITTQKRAYDRNKIKKDKKRKISATKSEEPLFSDAKNTSSLSSYEEKKKKKKKKKEKYLLLNQKNLYFLMRRTQAPFQAMKKKIRDTLTLTKWKIVP